MPMLAYGAIRTIAIAGSTQPLMVSTSNEELVNNLALQETVDDKIRRYANKYGISYYYLNELIGCETAYTYDPTIQSEARYTFNDVKRGIVKGERERSFGLAQIHEPDWPTITREQMYDPDFAIEFIAKNWKHRADWWYCWEKI